MKPSARPTLLNLGAFAAGLFLIAAAAAPSQAVTVITDLEGTLAKGSAPEVYFVGSDDRRYLFPNEKIFYSWYKDFSSVKMWEDDELAALPIGGTVTYRPGARLVKVPEDPKVYVVSGTGELRWLESEEVAKAIFGDAWAKQVDDVSGSLFADYRLGQSISKTEDYAIPDGAAESGPAVPETPPAVEPPQEAPADADNTVPAASDQETPAKFAVVSVNVSKTNSEGKASEDVRSFRFTYNRAYTGGRLTITEKNTGTVFYSEPFPKADEGSDGKTVTIWPDGWKAKLKLDTAYSWRAVAYAAPNATADEIAEVSSEFTATSSSVTTIAPEDAAFRIVSVTVDSVDGTGQQAEDVRTFNVEFNAPAKGVRLIITEKGSGKTVLSYVVDGGAVTSTDLSISPSGWGIKLEPNTEYSWKVTAYAAIITSEAPYQYDVASGEFTTADFTPSAGS